MEVVLAITILGLVSAPICSSLVLAARVNARSREVMTAQMNVSSAVERLMAEGVTKTKTVDEGTANEKVLVEEPSFIGITAEVTGGSETVGYYELEVYDAQEFVTVETAVKATPPAPEENAGGADS